MMQTLDNLRANNRKFSVIVEGYEFEGEVGNSTYRKHADGHLSEIGTCENRSDFRQQVLDFFFA